MADSQWPQFPYGSNIMYGFPPNNECGL
jgi:hypothetical protein